MKTLQECLTQVAADRPRRIIISKPKGAGEKYRKITAEQIPSGYQITGYTEKQAFHENISETDLQAKLQELILGHYRQLSAFSQEGERILLISKDGSCTMKFKMAAGAQKQTCSPAPLSENISHNRKKNYIIQEGTVVPPLVDMGIFTKDGKVVRSMYDKFRQINRFLEMIDDEVSRTRSKSLNIIDFGCGKSYLTFLIYYYLVEIRGIEANIIGLDLKEDVIERCNNAAEKYGYSALRFELGDINGYKAPFKVDMVVTLHACDKATDYALYNAISWGARMIFSVPCCQHELNGQFSPEDPSLLGQYGIIQERFSALATDAIRAAALECSGYRTQVLEFVDLAHTPKNLLIRAVKRPAGSRASAGKYRDRIKSLCSQFGFEPEICRLLNIPVK